MQPTECPQPACIFLAQAHVPLNEMFGYSTGLRSMTQVGAGVLSRVLLVPRQAVVSVAVTPASKLRTHCIHQL